MNTTRVILAFSCVGKTYADKYYKNVYDFDRHTLFYKYSVIELLKKKRGILVLSNIKAGSMFIQKILISVIRSGNYDVVTTVMNHDILQSLIDADIPVEVLLYSHNEKTSQAVKKRAADRGNKQYFLDLLERVLPNTVSIEDHPLVTVTIYDEPIYLTDHLRATGTTLLLKE